MRIAISGATGMIGSKLTAHLSAQGHQVVVIARSVSADSLRSSVIAWDPAINYVDITQLEGFDVFIHLSGANIAQAWTEEYKKEILESRLKSTKLLCKGLSKIKAKPKLLIVASAIGFYGNHLPDEELDENSPLGTGFLAEVCRQWEGATIFASQEGIRTVCMRLGVVLSKSGGALSQMLRPFEMGVGGVLGNGRQMMSWVALDEIPFVVDHVIKNETISGAVNVVSPRPVSNAQFTKILGHVIHRPTILPVPAFAIRLLFGEMGQTLLLEGARVIPRRLQESGYQFRFPDLKTVLEAAIN